MTGTPEVWVLSQGDRFEGSILAGDKVLVSAAWEAQ